MNDNVFIDTNILVYTYSNDEPSKKEIACNLILSNNTFISTQVIQELINTITRKFKYQYSDALNAITECCNNSNLFTNNHSTIIQACNIAERYKFSFYDSLILSAALDSNCSIIYTEDMNDGQVINDKLTIKNPFAA